MGARVSGCDGRATWLRWRRTRWGLQADSGLDLRPQPRAWISDPVPLRAPPAALDGSGRQRAVAGAYGADQADCRAAMGPQPFLFGSPPAASHRSGRRGAVAAAEGTATSKRISPIVMLKGSRYHLLWLAADRAGTSGWQGAVAAAKGARRASGSGPSSCPSGTHVILSARRRPRWMDPAAGPWQERDGRP